MSKEEMREMRKGGSSAAGYAAKELEQIEKLQKVSQGTDMEIITLTAGCSEIYTLICCQYMGLGYPMGEDENSLPFLMCKGANAYKYA